MSSIGYTRTLEDLKSELLIRVKALAVNEIFGEMVTPFSKMTDFSLTEDSISAYTSGFIRIQGNPLYESGKNLGDICATINAYATQEDKNKLNPLRISNKQCAADSDLTTKN